MTSAQLEFDLSPPYKKRVIPQSSRRAVALAAGAIPGETVEVYCEVCGFQGWAYWPNRWKDGEVGAWVHFADLELDHIHPERHGGTSDPSNLRLLCRRCNRSKGSKV